MMLKKLYFSLKALFNKLQICPLRKQSNQTLP